MKTKTFFSAAAIALSLSAFTTFSTAEKDVLGTWKLDEASIPQMVDGIITKAVAAAPDAEDKIKESKGEIVELVKSLQVTYKADGTYESASTQGLKHGKWVLTDKNHNIQITKADGTTRKDSILELTASKFKLLNRELKVTTLYVRP
ncbi:hypothetical protein [Mucilaginibacter glaciei]|uniref:Lipocalin-like domain-containing protein n=1 Tax=Mucilaginibacter glaciei TaxID=2772109 RepID=A0A926NNK4_9SPHI|nr:hypothetical protein [Mucilaginibacter glaciei]MBD1394461.1 hypothetical protein [Mucilaginibacter glaciei]